MICPDCKGWMFYTVAELDGRERVVVKCKDCGKMQPIRRDQPMQTQRMVQEQSELKALPVERHDEYLWRRAAEEGLTLSGWVACGRIWA